MSTFTSLSLLALPQKEGLRDAFVGKSLSSLRTPACIIDRTRFRENCERVTGEAEKRGMKFRAHVKTHKTIEGTRMQVQASGGVKSLICSTMVEVWQLVESGLVEEGLVDDILYSMPIAVDRIEDLNNCQSKVGSKAVIRLMLDNAGQVELLEAFNEKVGRTTPWSVFIKVDGGGRRAGVPPTSSQMKDLLKAAISSSAVEIFGFYSHFGQSYASTNLDKASEYFAGEIECVNAAAGLAKELGASGSWTLSVGATPTAHAATQKSGNSSKNLHGDLELHAGCYCLCDLQQLSTTLITHDQVALSILATVVSNYPHRSEAMCDAGALAVSKDTGPLPGYGHVITPKKAIGWDLGRISQEHGTLIHRPQASFERLNQDFVEACELNLGERVRIVPQHACLVCASYPWFYVVEDGGDVVVDVWVPWKGW